MVTASLPSGSAAGTRCDRPRGSSRTGQLRSRENNQRSGVVYNNMHALHSPHIANGDYLDRSKWTLSKRRAADIISAVKAEHDFLREQD
jgi:hypothetical protein